MDPGHLRGGPLPAFVLEMEVEPAGERRPRRRRPALLALSIRHPRRLLHGHGRFPTAASGEADFLDAVTGRDGIGSPRSAMRGLRCCLTQWPVPASPTPGIQRSLATVRCSPRVGDAAGRTRQGRRTRRGSRRQALDGYMLAAIIGTARQSVRRSPPRQARTNSTNTAVMAGMASRAITS